MSVGVGEQAGLEDAVRRGLNARPEVQGLEHGLFDLGEVVLRVLVEHDLVHRA